MRMPSESEISEEQRDILDAPTSESILSKDLQEVGKPY